LPRSSRKRRVLAGGPERRTIRTRHDAPRTRRDSVSLKL
jgi:hypothetical protein